MSAKNILLKEITAVSVLAIFSVGLATFFDDYIFIEAGKIRFIPTLIAFLPLINFYFLIRIFFARFSSLLLSILFYYLLMEINQVKQALTGEPLSWTDISNTSNLSVIQHYISLMHFIFLIIFCLIIFLLIKFKQIRSPKLHFFIFTIIFSLISFPIAFYPYAATLNTKLGYKIEDKISDWGVLYYSWDWADNLKYSGLLLHIIQTSHRKIPTKSTDIEKEKFAQLISQNNVIAQRPKNVIFILCEACWYDEKHFRSLFAPLNKFDFIEFRAISPVYGGGTVNSAFELLTGLPSHGVLDGIIYQEYASSINQNAIALPRAMQSLGYKTIAAHNNYKKFWRRDLIKPKLGFEQFLALEDMNYDGPIWADDQVLFSKVLKEIKTLGSPAFYFLTTAYTHGGYPFDNDFGEKNYSKRLEHTISRVSDFVDQVLTHQPDSAILIIGDHKPALTKYFFTNDIFPNSLFSKTGTHNNDFRFKPKSMGKIVGDVPALFYYPNKILARKLAAHSNNKPFYCVSNYFNDIFIGSEMPVFSFIRKNSLCSDFDYHGYYDNANKFPEYIFSLSLFE